jgi:hypothetical protein
MICAEYRSDLYQANHQTESTTLNPLSVVRFQSDCPHISVGKRLPVVGSDENACHFNNSMPPGFTEWIFKQLPRSFDESFSLWCLQPTPCHFLL